jgi:glyoxylate reductase
MTGADVAAGRVFVTRPLPRAWLAPLSDAGLTVDVHDGDDPLPTAALHARVAGAVALWVQLTDQVDASLLDAAGPELKVVATYSVGTNHVDAAACRERGVAVVHTPDVLTDATADLTLALLLAAARRLPEGQRLVESGDWRGWAATQLLGMELRGRTLGVVGLGRIGAAVAERARAFGMRIVYHQRTARPEVAGPLGATFVEDLDRLASVSDVLTLHAPLTPATRHLIDARRLALLPKHALLINAARGPLVDEGALVAALREGRLAGAGLDVYEEEPRVHPGLLELPNVVLAPHLGSATDDTRRAMAELCTSGILSALAGGRPANALA